MGATDTEILSQEQVKRILSLPVQQELRNSSSTYYSIIYQIEKDAVNLQITSVRERENNYPKTETDKLNKWVDDRLNASKIAIKDTKRRIRALNREAQKTTEPQGQLKIQQELHDLSKKQKK